MRRIAISLLFFVISCKKVAEEKNVPEPDDLIAVVSVDSPKDALARFAKFAEGISPGAGRSLTPDLLGQGLGGLVGAPTLRGVDLGKPVYLLILDPKKHKAPTALLVGVDDAEALKTAPRAKVVIEGNHAVVGAAEAVDVLSAYALGVLAARKAPEAVTLTASPTKLVARYRADIDDFRQMMQKMSPAPGMAALVDSEVELFMKLSDQTERAQVVVDADKDEASFEMSMVATAGSMFDKFNHSQGSGLDASLLARLPAVDNPAMVMVGHYQLGPARDLVMGLMVGVAEKITGTKLDPAKWSAWLDLFDGNMAMQMWYAAAGTVALQEVFGVADGAKAAELGRDLLGVSGEHAGEVFGMKLGWAALGQTSTHDGVPVYEYSLKPDYASIPGPGQEALRRVYGDELHLYLAGFDKTYAMVMGAGGAEQLGKVIDAARKGSGGPVTAPMQAAIDAAKGRKSSIVMLMNPAATLSPGSPAPLEAGLAIEIGFSGGAAKMRFGVPAAAVKGLMSAAMGARRH